MGSGANLKLDPTQSRAGITSDEATTSLRCASYWCWLRADHMLTVAASPLLSLSQPLNLSLLAPLLSASQSSSASSCTFSACPSRPPSLPLSAHFLNVVCIYPPAVCSYSLFLSPLSLSIAVNPPALSLTLSACPSQSLS